MRLDPVRIKVVELLLEGRSGTWHRCFSWFGASGPNVSNHSLLSIRFLDNHQYDVYERLLIKVKGQNPLTANSAVTTRP
jgi:hypothetical protein